MYTAETSLANVKANDCVGPESKKRRSGGDPSMLDENGVTGKLNGNGNGSANVQGNVNHINGSSSPQKTSPMSICLDDLPPILDLSSKPNGSAIPLSAPASSTQGVEYFCPACGRCAGTLSMNKSTVSPTGSPLVVPPGPLSAAAFESGMSAVEELKLLKAQVQDVARVCKASTPFIVFDLLPISSLEIVGCRSR
jgi:osomolarity two-component system sensor histidine kinase NIK1